MVSMEFVHTAILILHILGAVVIGGAALFALIFSANDKLSDLALRAMPTIARLGQWGALSQLLTGLYLFGSEEKEIRPNPLIWIKLALYVIDGFVAGALINKRITSHGIRATKTLFAVHLVLLVIIIALGVGVAEAPRD